MGRRGKTIHTTPSIFRVTARSCEAYGIDARRPCPIMRFDRCFVARFLYFEFYTISSVKLFRRQFISLHATNRPDICMHNLPLHPITNYHSIENVICDYFSFKECSLNSYRYREITIFVNIYLKIRINGNFE